MLILVLATQLSGACSYGFPAPPPGPRTSHGSEELKVHPDGTATVTGIVLENRQACKVDGRCFLRLRVWNREVVVVYAPAEGESVTYVRKIRKEWKIQKGDRVKAYGRKTKESNPVIEVFSSESFYVHALQN